MVKKESIKSLGDIVDPITELIETINSLDRKFLIENFSNEITQIIKEIKMKSNKAYNKTITTEACLYCYFFLIFVGTVMS